MLNAMESFCFPVALPFGLPADSSLDNKTSTLRARITRLIQKGQPDQSTTLGC
jgi:hypothetical protein